MVWPLNTQFAAAAGVQLALLKALEPENTPLVHTLSCAIEVQTLPNGTVAAE